MKPILFIHGYSSEGHGNTVEEIYGTLPDDLRRAFGNKKVLDLNLSRWISLSDGVNLDDVSLAMDRALRSRHKALLRDGFHVVIHSTGALVVRNWIRNHCLDPSTCPFTWQAHTLVAGLPILDQGSSHAGPDCLRCILAVASRYLMN